MADHKPATPHFFTISPCQPSMVGKALLYRELPARLPHPDRKSCFYGHCVIVQARRRRRAARPARASSPSVVVEGSGMGSEFTFITKNVPASAS